MQERQIILASASPRRKELLKQMGLVFRVVPSRREETVTGASPAQIVENLSYQKAEDALEQIMRDAAFRTEPGVLVIGSDTIVVCGGSIMGKPGTQEEAFRMLRSLQGRTHDVYTGVTIISLDGDKREHESFSEKASVRVHEMEEREIRDYIAKGESMDKAGGYGIQGGFAVFVEEIRGEYGTVLGLPVAALYQALKKYRK